MKIRNKGTGKTSSQNLALLGVALCVLSLGRWSFLKTEGYYWWDVVAWCFGVAGGCLLIKSREIWRRINLWGPRERLMQEVTEALVSVSASKAEMAKVVFEKVGPFLKADVLFNYEIEDGQLKLVGGFGIPETLMPSAKCLGMGVAFCGTVADSGVPLFANCERVTSDPKGEFVKGMRVTAYMCHPLKSREGAVIGTLSFASTKRDHFDEQDTDLLQTVSRFLSLAWERLASEKSLRESEERLRQMTESIREVFWLCDASCEKLIYLSSAYEATWGRSCAEALSARGGWLSAVHEDDRESLRELRARAAEAGYDREYRVRRPDGTVRWVRERAFPVKDREGRPWRVTGVTEDVTEKRLAADELKRVQASLEEAQEKARFGNWEVAPATGYRWWSKEMFGLFGLDPAQGVPPLDEFHRMVHPDDLCVLQEAERACCESRQAVTVEFRSHPDRRPLRHYSAILHSEMRDGVLLFTGVTQDITERRETENAKRVLELQLRQSQKMEALGTLAGGIAHDFNNLLFAILGNAELVALGMPEGDPNSELVAEIRKAGSRARDLVQRILTFSRPQVAMMQSLNLEDVVDEVVRLLRATLPAGVELVAPGGAGAPVVSADAAQVHQVLLNLATNAWHAMDGKSGRIEFRLNGCRVDSTLSNLYPDLHPGSYTVLSVKDNGRGMDEPTLARIYEPFFTTKPPGVGTGLGLSVVHGIMRGHGGAILAESTPGEGTVFHLYFPAGVRDAEQPAVVGEGAREAPEGHGEHLVYIDDEPSLVLLMRRLLEGLGYRFSGFTRAEEALATISVVPGDYDLVITDYNMPGISGLEVARHLGRTGLGLKVVMISGYISEELKERASEAGVQAVLYKPDTVEKIGHVLPKLLAGETLLESENR